MEFFYSALAAQIIFILGIINLLSGIVLLLTCRCIPQIWRGVMQNSFFKSFYKIHCWVWWVFWISVVTHIVFSLGRTGIPF